jgi:hypothetical protein
VRFVQYSTSLYWALTTMTTVGYGDITPISTQERWFTMLVFVFGAISYSSIFANVSMLLQSVDENGHRYRTKLSTVGKLLRFCKVRAALRCVPCCPPRYFASLWMSDTQHVCGWVNRDARIPVSRWLPHART